MKKRTERILAGVFVLLVVALVALVYGITVLGDHLDGNRCDALREGLGVEVRFVDGVCWAWQHGAWRQI